VYGACAPDLSVRYDGFVNNDDPSVVGGELHFFSDVNFRSDVGVYAVTPADASAPNYHITFAAGTLTLTKADQNIFWTNLAPIVSGTPLDSPKLNAVVPVRNLAPGGALTYSVADGTILHAGLGQALTVTAAGTNNYNPAQASVTIDVTPAVLTVTADD